MNLFAPLALGLSLAVAVPVSATAATAPKSESKPAPKPATKPDPERAYIDGAFAAVDTDKSGTITRAEFEVFMAARIKKQRDEFDKGFAAADVNGDGGIDRNEAKIHEDLVKHFDQLDADKDGKLSKREMTAALLAAMQQGLPAAGG